MTKENSLFNETTIKRLVLDIQITAKQKKAVSKWLSYLKDKKLENEKQAYIEFAQVILRDLLNYDISLDGLKHEEANMEFPFRDNLGNYLVVFEVKGMKTKNLRASQGRNRKTRETPVSQINSYMYEQKIPFGILTNYQEFILFDRNEGSKKDYSIDFTELTNENKLKEFVALFSREQIEKGFISEVIQKSIIEEREFTKEFYKLYHETRLMLIKEFEENSDIGRAASVHFAQLYLNRLMFVFFAEDTGKINKRIIEERILKTLDNIHLFSSNSAQISNVLVGLFKDLDKGSDFPIKVFGFNGGLFQHPIPPKIYFRDFRDDKFFKEVNQYSKLKKKDLELNEKVKEIFEKYKNKINPVIKNILLMASFDFKSEVNVNILGHIFEQSISDIEDLKTDKSSRRKKEGIFYTPEYITDYICRNTIIPYLSEKGVNVVVDLIKEYADNIEELEKKFKAMKILDPACGSGAFLIKATDIMLEIFKAIQEFKQQEGEYKATRGLKKKSNTKGQLVLGKWNEEAEAREIIENSIYGVDINEESVGITKLSLFLKMARKNRKLTNLSNNIKQGNSLIDDEEVAGKLAFKWEKEFPFKFDVVIGNPPYVSNWTLSKHDRPMVEHLEKKHKQYLTGHWDLFNCFIALSIKLLKENGIHSFVLPSTFLKEKYTKPLRQLFIDELKIERIVDFGEKIVFDNVARQTIIYVVRKTKDKNNLITMSFGVDGQEFKVSQKFYKKLKNFVFKTNVNEKDTKIYDKLNEDSIFLGRLLCINTGVVAHSKIGSKLKFKKNDVIHKKHQLGFKKYVIGSNMKRYFIGFYGDYLDYDSKQKHFHRAKYPLLFESKKIVIRRISGANNKIIANYDEEKYYTNDNLMHAVFWSEKILEFQKPENKWDIICNSNFDLRFIVSILSSKLFTYFFSKFLSTDTLQGSYSSIYPEDLRVMPIKQISPPEQKPFIEKVDLMLKLNKEFYEKKNKFFNRIKKSFDLEKINKKLDKFYGLEFNDFVLEIEKQSKKKISLKEQDDWEDYFNGYKKELVELQDGINKTDNEIDKMVYELYGLSDEEVGVVEGSAK